MADKLELMQEAQRRGLLSPDQTALLTEAQNRGLTAKPDALHVAAATPEKPGTLVKMGRGMMDLYQGVKQLGLMASDAFTGGKDANTYTKQVGEEIANYEKGRAASGDTGFDWSRLAGNIANPAILIPAGTGPTLAARVATGVAGGAAQAGLMYTPEGHSKLGQMAVGATVGGAVPAVAQGVSSTIRNAANKSATTAAQLVRAGVEDSVLIPQLQTIVGKSGLDWNKLTVDAQNALKQEAQAQLKTGNGLNAEALDRLARAKALDPRLELTRGQATRKPADWQTEQNLRGIQGPGDGLRARFMEQGQVLSEAGERIRGPSISSFQAGDRAIKTVQQKFEETGDAVSALYKAAKDTVGAQANVPLGPMQVRGMQALQDFDDVIPGPIKTRLQALGIDRMGQTKATKAFTVEEAEALDKIINKRWDASNKPLTAALSEIKGAIRESLDKIGDGAGTDAAKAFRAAKTAAAGRFDEFGEKIAKASTDDVAPDKFVRRFVLGGDVRDIQALSRTLSTGTPEQIARGGAALNHLRGAALSEIFDGRGVVADGVLSGAKLDKALKDIGSERLQAIFTPDQIKQLQLLRGVSLDLTKPPAFSDINYSRTSQALANLLGTIGKVPGLGLVAKAGQAEAERAQRATANATLTGTATETPRLVELMSGQTQGNMARNLSRLAPGANALTYRENQ